VHSSSRRTVHINAAAVAPSEEDGSEFTTATLESKRGTITALFNVTMILAQTFVGLLSGLIIDVAGNITVTITHKHMRTDNGHHSTFLRVCRGELCRNVAPYPFCVFIFIFYFLFFLLRCVFVRSFSTCRA